MIFGNLPEGVQAAGTDIIISLEECDPDRITEAHILNDGKTVGIKRFRGDERYDVNVSCYLKDSLDIEPYFNAASCGFARMGSWMGSFGIRVTQYDPAEDGPPDGAVWIEAEELPFTAGTDVCPSMRFLTTMDGVIEISPDETLCLSVFVNAPGATSYLYISVPGGRNYVEFPPVYGVDGKMYAYFINPAYIAGTLEYPFDEMTELEIQLIAEKTVLDSRKIEVAIPPVQGTRICWVNKYGTVDTFTFSPVQKATGSADKARVLGEEGYRIAGVEWEDSFTVVSPFMAPERLADLSSLLSSPKIWVIEERGAVRKRIDVITTKSEMDFNSPGILPVTFRYC